VKKILIISAAVLLAATLAVGCSSDEDTAPSTTSATDTTTPPILTFADPATPIAVVPGQEFAIKVPSNASTGFTWSITGAPDPAVVSVVDAEGNVEAAPNGNGAVGTGGSTILTFKAVASGTTTVTMTYARPSDPAANPEVTTFTVNVS
jgi:inhibitor of cysteine peptidase